MKKTIYILLFLVSYFSFAQQGPNPFAEPQSENTFSHDSSLKDEKPPKDQVQSKDGSGGGNPADPTPIDDYLPLLLIAAIGLIVYQVRKQKQVN